MSAGKLLDGRREPGEVEVVTGERLGERRMGGEAGVVRLGARPAPGLGVDDRPQVDARKRAEDPQVMAAHGADPDEDAAQRRSLLGIVAEDRVGRPPSAELQVASSPHASSVAVGMSARSMSVSARLRVTTPSR